MASYYWIKLYHEILDDPKMGRLSDHLWRRAIEMFLFAGKQGGNGGVPCVADMAWSLRTTPADLQEDLNELERIGIIRQGDGADPFVVHFEQRQAPVTSTERSTRRRTRERQKQYAGETPPKRQSWRTELYGELPEKPGIYRLTCHDTGQCYVGASINVRNRIKAHLSEMATNHGHPLYDDFQEWGHQSIEVEILETTDNPDELKTLEARYQQAEGETYNREAAKRNGHWTERGRNESATNRATELDQSREETDKESAADAPAADAAPAGNGPTTFQEWQAEIKDSTNRTAVLRHMCEVLYPGLDPPAYGYIGKTARKVGGAGRLADLLWQCTPHPPTGDLLAYIQGVAKNGGKPGSKPTRQTQEPAGVTGWTDE